MFMLSPTNVFMFLLSLSDSLMSPTNACFVSTLFLRLQLVMTMIFGWKEVGTILRVVWKCATRDSGEQCVVTPGIWEMQWLSADSLITPHNVRKPLPEHVLWCCLCVCSVYWRMNYILLFIISTQLLDTSPPQVNLGTLFIARSRATERAEGAREEAFMRANRAKNFKTNKVFMFWFNVLIRVKESPLFPPFLGRPGQKLSWSLARFDTCSI